MQVIPRLILNFLTKEFFLSIFNRQGAIAPEGREKMGRHAKLLRRVQPVEVRMECRVADPPRKKGQTAFQGKILSLAVRVWVEMLKQDVTILLAGAGRFLHRNFPRPESKRARFPIRCCSRGSRDGLYPGSIQGHRPHFLRGGTLKEFIQQTKVTANRMGLKVQGYRHAIQATTDAPHWGGAGGCTFEEAHSWGKISGDAKKINLYCDSSTAFRLMVTAGIQESAALPYHRIRPEIKKLWSWPLKNKIPLKAKMSHNK